MGVKQVTPYASVTEIGVCGRAGGFCSVELPKIVLISNWKDLDFGGVVQGGKSKLV